MKKLLSGRVVDTVPLKPPACGEGFQTLSLPTLHPDDPETAC